MRGPGKQGTLDPASLPSDLAQGLSTFLATMAIARAEMNGEREQCRLLATIRQDAAFQATVARGRALAKT